MSSFLLTPTCHKSASCCQYCIQLTNSCSLPGTRCAWYSASDASVLSVQNLEVPMNSMAFIRSTVKSASDKLVTYMLEPVFVGRLRHSQPRLHRSERFELSKKAFPSRFFAISIGASASVFQYDSNSKVFRVDQRTADWPLLSKRGAFWIIALCEPSLGLQMFATSKSPREINRHNKMLFASGKSCCNHFAHKEVAKGSKNSLRRQPN